MVYIIIVISLLVGLMPFSELMDGQKEYKKKLMRLQKQQQKADVDAFGNPPENEMTRIGNKIKKLLAFKKAAEKKAKDEAEKARDKDQKVKLGKIGEIMKNAKVGNAIKEDVNIEENTSKEESAS